MKKGLFVAIISLFILCSCGTKATDSSVTKDSMDKIEIYGNDEPFSIDNAIIALDSAYCSSDYVGNYNLSIYFKIKNTSLESQKYNIKNVTLTKENTSVTYKTTYTNSLTIDPELVDEFQFEAVIPSHVRDDKYNLAFSINSKKVVLYMYEKPDELRDKWNVEYFVDSNQVKNITVIDGHSVDQYVYESSDHFYYCVDWYLDKSFTNKFDYHNPVNGNLELYGKKRDNFYFTTTSSDKYYFLNRVDYLHTDRKIYIPRSYGGKELAIGAYAFSSEAGRRATEIYVPINVRLLYQSSFGNISKDVVIYYEGTQDQWKALFYTGGVFLDGVIFNSTIPY